MEEQPFSDNPLRNAKAEKKSNPLLQFFLGILMFGAGVFLIMQNTVIYTDFNAISAFVGFNMPFGLILLPTLIGIGMLFFNDKSVFGWILLIFGVITILLSILLILKISFRPVTLYYGIIMYGLTAAGAGLFLKSVFGKKN